MNNIYETDELLNQYMAFHFGSSYFGVPNYPARCAELCIEFMGSRPRRKALDLGCAVGRSSFDLALGFDKVVGMDLSSRFVDAANRMKAGETLPYFLHDEGELGRTVEVSLGQFDFSAVRNKVEFEVGDACNLGVQHSGYDLIFAGNLIDRVFRGYVVDSFDFYWRDWHWPAFNLADTAIVLGALLFVSSSLLGKKANTNAEPDGSD